MKSFRLPYTSLRVSYSVEYFNHAERDLVPDLAAPPSAEAFSAGRDPALEAVTGR